MSSKDPRAMSSDSRTRISTSQNSSNSDNKTQPIDRDSEGEKLSPRPSNFASMSDNPGNVVTGPNPNSPVSGGNVTASGEICPPSTVLCPSVREVRVSDSEGGSHASSEQFMALQGASSRRSQSEELAAAIAANRGDVSLGDINWDSLPANVELYKHIVGKSQRNYGERAPPPKESLHEMQPLDLNELPALLSSDDDSLPPNNFYPESDSGSSEQSISRDPDLAQLYGKVMKSSRIYGFTAQKIESEGQITLLIRTDENDLECIEVDDRHREMLEILEADDMIKDVNQFSA